MWRLRGGFQFFAPLVALAVVWAVVVRAFDVTPRIFPDITAVAYAALDSLRDGSLGRHVGASLWRVAAGTTLALALSIPLGVAMGVSAPVSSFFTPLVRFFSVLAGIAWIPI